MYTKLGLTGLFISLLVSCATTSTLPNSLDGRWKFSTVDCADHKLGKGAQQTKQYLEKGDGEEFYVFDGTKAEFHLIERNGAKDQQSFCETIYTENLSTSPDILHFSAMTMTSRKSFGNYQCYQLFNKNAVARKDFDLRYELNGSELKIIHKDTTIKDSHGIRHQCENGADLFHIYRKF